MGKKLYFKAFQVCQNQIQLQDFLNIKVEMLLKLQIKMVLYHIELLNKYFNLFLMVNTIKNLHIEVPNNGIGVGGIVIIGYLGSQGLTGPLLTIH